MIRRLTAFALLWLMTVVVATSQPGLSYCLCLQEVFVGGCECSDLVPQSTCSLAASDGDCNCSSEKPSETPNAELSSCLDCSLSLFVELNDFVGASSLQMPSQASSDFNLPIGWNAGGDPALTLRNCIHGIRGSPPPAKPVSCVSLQVRYSVFLV